MKKIDEIFNWGQLAFKNAELLKKSKCRIRVYAGADRDIVIVSELPDNRGRSVTNGAEEIIEHGCDSYGLEFDRCLWIEHYPPSESEPKETTDRVFLIANENPQGFEREAEAHWESYPIQELEQAIGEKL